MSGFVYFVRSGSGGPIKIGFSGDWQRRVATLQTAHHEALDVLLVLGDCGDKAERLERVLHKAFAHRRKSGEWFDPGEDLITFIDALVAAGCDGRRKPYVPEPAYVPEPDAAVEVRVARDMRCCDVCDRSRAELTSRSPRLKWTQEHSCDGQARFEAMLLGGWVLAAEPGGDVWLEDERGDECWRTDCYDSGGGRDFVRAVEQALTAYAQRIQ